MKEIILTIAMFLVGFYWGAMPIHHHHWVVVSTNYQAGVNVTEAKWIDPGTLDRIIHGYTAIRYRCSDDGEEKIETFTGLIK